MRILLFDWMARGHHELYIRRFVEALAPRRVVAAVPEVLAERLSDTRADIISLGPARPPIDEGQHLSREKSAATRAELELFLGSIARARPDHAVHLFADGILHALVRERTRRTPITLLLFRPRAHYPRSFESRLSAREKLVGWSIELLLARWRRRSDAYAVLTLDEYAARRWAESPGAPAHWLPEPPSCRTARPPFGNREGCALVGALAPRKGIELLARAVALEPMSLRVVLAGPAVPGFGKALYDAVAQMRRAHARVELRDHWHAEQDLLELIAGARCSVLPYPRHVGMSRGLVEAAAAGTPVVAHEWGLLGHLVRRYGLGLAVDCRDARAFRRAILSFAKDEDGSHWRPALDRFASRYSDARFRQALDDVFGPGERVPMRTGEVTTARDCSD